LASTFEYIDSAYSSSDASQDTLNIRIGENELSYFISDRSSKITLQRHFNLSVDRITSIAEHLAHSDLKSDFSKVRISIYEAFTLVPSDIFRPADILYHFRNSLGSSQGKELQFDQVKHEGVVLVYGIDKELLNILESTFKDFDYLNAHTVLLNAYYKEKVQDRPQQTFINFDHSNFTFTHLNERRLVYSNSFRYKSAEDCLYYIVRIAKELNMDLNVQECIFSGGIEYTDSVYKLLNDYLNKIEFIKRPSELLYSDEHYRRLPSNAFYDLYSMSRCE